MAAPKSRAQLPHLLYPKMNVTRTINAHRAAAPSFGLASRDFDGSNDRVSFSANNLGTGDFSVAYWFKTSHTGFGYGCSEGGNPVSSSKGFGSAFNNGALYGFIHDGVRLVFSGVGSGYNDGEWYHRVDNFDRDGNWSVYIDGNSTPVGSQSISARSGSVSNNQTFYFSFLDSGSNYWLGSIADMRVYSRLLTVGEIANLAAGTDIDSTGLEGWWLLNDDDVLDYSGNGNDGTNYGSTYSTDGPLD